MFVGVETNDFVKKENELNICDQRSIKMKKEKTISTTLDTCSYFSTRSKNHEQRKWNEMKWKIVNTKITEKEGMICFNIINKYITRRLAKERHEKMKETQRKTRERGRGREKRSMNYVKTEEEVKKASKQNVYG